MSLQVKCRHETSALGTSLLLPRLLRCQSIPSQSFYESGGDFFAAPLNLWSSNGLGSNAFCRYRSMPHEGATTLSGPAGSARASSTNVLMMQASGVRHEWGAPSGRSSPCPKLTRPKCGRRASRRFVWRWRAQGQIMAHTGDPHCRGDRASDRRVS